MMSLAKKRKRFLQAALVSIFLFVLVFFFYSVIRFIAFHIFRYDFSSHEIGILLACVLAAVLFYKPLDYVVFLFFKEVLFRSHTRDFAALAQLAHTSRSILNQTELANVIANTFGETWGLRVVSVLVADGPARLQYHVASAFGLKPSVWRDLKYDENSPLIQLLLTRMAPVERERVMKSFSWQEANQLTRDFEYLHATCIIPMFFEGELIGSINIAPRGVSHPFRPAELKSFMDFANEIAVAFGNSLLYTELEKRNNELKRIQSELLFSAQHSAIAQLAVGIAHEIHNPLTIISGKAQILLLKRDKIAYDPQVEEVLKTIVKQTKRAADITRKLLMFSDTQKSAKEAIDFESLINDTIALLSYQVSLDQIQVTKGFTHPLPKWEGNVSELREAFLNLFLNAVQAVGTKGTIEVHVRYRDTDGVIECRVSDSGPGISDENRTRVFQPFFTTRDNGSGLGLFVTEQIVRGYGGTILVDSIQGQGATFIVEFPCQIKAEVPQESTASKPLAVPEAAGQ